MLLLIGLALFLHPRCFCLAYNVTEGRMQLVETLHPDYNYTVRIAAATEPGIGPFSDAIIVRTVMDGEFASSQLLRRIKLSSILYSLCKQSTQVTVTS